MYSIDSQDRLIRLEAIPPCSVGAPNPAILGTEHYTALCYLAAKQPPDGWHGQYTTMVNHRSVDQTVVIIEFRICADVRFGWFPDENTCPNHPLAAIGLESYAAYEVENSSWVRRLAKLESGNRDVALKTKRHFIFTFHDTSVECVADSFKLRQQAGSIQSTLTQLAVELGES